MGELLAFSALVMFAVNSLVVAEASRRVDYSWGFFIALLVNTVVAAGVVSAGLLVSGDAFTWDLTAVMLFLLAGLCATYLGRLLFFITVVGMGPSRSGAFQITQPLFASVLAFAFLGERLAPMEVALMLVVVAGLFIVNRSRAAAMEASPTSVPEAARRRQRFGDATPSQRLLLAAIGSGVCYAAGNVLRSAAVNRWNEPFVGAALGALAGLGCYLAFHVRVGDVVARLRRTERGGFALFIVSGVLMILAQTASIASLRYLPVAIANLFSVSVPILVVPLSVLLLHNREGVTRVTVMGVLVTWVGVVGMVLV